MGSGQWAVKKGVAWEALLREGVLEAVDQATNFPGESQDRLDRRLFDETDANRNVRLRLDLAERTVCDTEKLHELAGRPPTLSLGDVRRDRDSGTPYL